MQGLKMNESEGFSGFLPSFVKPVLCRAWRGLKIPFQAANLGLLHASLGI